MVLSSLFEFLDFKLLGIPFLVVNRKFRLLLANLLRKNKHETHHLKGVHFL